MSKPQAKIIVTKKQDGTREVRCGQAGSDKIIPAGTHSERVQDGNIRELKARLEQSGSQVDIVER